LEYDENTELDRNEVEYFVRNIKSLIARGATEDVDARFHQIFRMFCVMSLNVLKTGNSTGNSSASRNATMVMSDLRHAICVHFENLMQTFDLNEDYSHVFLAHFNGGKLPEEWHQYLLELREDVPDDLDAWIAKKYPDRSAFNTQTKEKIWFGDSIYNTATDTVKVITLQYNPLWKPEEKPSGKSMADFFRAVKVLLAKKAYHAKALDACRKHKNTKSGEWGDIEKVKYVVDKVNNGMAVFDPETQHPNCWLAWLMCSYPIDFFVPERKLSLTIAVPPEVLDNSAAIPSKGIRHLERGKSALVRGTATAASTKTSSSSNSTTELPTTFLHKVSIITRPEDERELHHQQVVIETLRGTIASLQAINPEQYKQQIEDLNNQLVDALLEQVEVLRLRSNAFREARLRIDNTSLTAKVIVADASAAVGLSSSPNIPVVNSMLSHSREQIIRTTPVPTNTTLVMGSISSSDAIADVPRPALRKTTQQSMQQSNSSSTTVSWVDAEHFNQKMHFAYGYPNDPSSWMQNSQPTLYILNTMHGLRDTLTNSDDRWQVEMWIKRIAEYLEVPHELVYDERDRVAEISSTILQGVDKTSDVVTIPDKRTKANKRQKNASFEVTNKKRKGVQSKNKSAVHSSDEDTPEPIMPTGNQDNEYIFEDFN